MSDFATVTRCTYHHGRGENWMCYCATEKPENIVAYALVPVESMEQVWWCVEERADGYEMACTTGHPQDHRACGPRWLVTPEEER